MNYINRSEIVQCKRDDVERATGWGLSVATTSATKTDRREELNVDRALLRGNEVNVGNQETEEGKEERAQGKCYECCQSDSCNCGKVRQ